MAGKVFSGARAKLGFYDASTQQVVIVGIFSNVTYGLTYDVQPAYILGRYSAAELNYTSQDVIHISASGWRVVGQGPHVAARIPALQDLLTHEYLQMTIVDRQTENAGQPGRVMTVTGIRPTGYSTTITSRQQVEVSCSFVGLLVSDESVTNAEHAKSTDLP